MHEGGTAKVLGRAQAPADPQRQARSRVDHPARASAPTKVVSGLIFNCATAGNVRTVAPTERCKEPSFSFSVRVRVGAV